MQAPAGPVFRGADVPAGTGPRVVVAPNPEYLGVAAVLLAVPDEVTRVTMAPVATSVPPGVRIDCALGGGFALCTFPTTDLVVLTAYAGSAAIPVPVRVSASPPRPPRPGRGRPGRRGCG